MVDIEYWVNKMHEQYVKSGIITVGQGNYFDYCTDGEDDAAEINDAFNSLDISGTVMLYGDFHIDPANPIVLNYVPTPTNQWSNTGNWRDFATSGNKVLSGANFGQTNGARLIKDNWGTAGNVIRVDGYYTTIANLTINGNQIDNDYATSPSPGSNGIELLHSPYNIIEYVDIYGCGDNGIKIAPESTHTTSCTDWHDIWIGWCYRGISQYSGGDLCINNLIIMNTRKETLLQDIGGGYTAFDNCHFWVNGNGLLNEATRQYICTNDQVDNVTLSGIGSNIFTACTFDNWYWYGVYADDPGSNTFNGCLLYGAWSDHNNLDDYTFGMRFASPSSHNVVSGCSFQDWNNVCNYAVSIDAGSNKNVIIGNAFHGHGISNQGTGNVIQHNT
jgi:hypothetical protein